jgi:aminopeptidase N
MHAKLFLGMLHFFGDIIHISWDEPAVKAIFEVSLIAPKDRAALSNMNVVSTKDYSDELKIVTFAPSPIMSTYLLAFIVGEFDFV